MGKLINANKEEFQHIIDSEKNLVLVDFWAEWCGPCRTLSPILEDIADEVDSVTIIKVNVDENAELSAQLGIRGIPAVFLFKDGKNIDKFIGMKTKVDILSIIKRNTEEADAKN